MREFVLASLLLLVAAAAARAQAPAGPPTEGEADAAAQLKASLLFDLRALEAEAAKLDHKLEAAAARAEIAAAAWPLEREWAEKLLREALELTFPERVDRARLRERPVGAALSPPTPEDVARGMVRQRVLEVAGRDRALSEELAEISSRELGRVAAEQEFSRLASRAAGQGRLDEAAGYILQAIDAEPTLIGPAFSINQVAAHDRAAADRLIIQYVERLRALPVTTHVEGNGSSLLRLRFGFDSIMGPGSMFPIPGAPTPPAPPGREAVRAYVAFVLETAAAVEQLRPGARAGRAFLLSAWPLLSGHAPELTGQFIEIEKASRPAGEAAPELLSPAARQERGRKSYEDRLKMARKTKDQTDLEMAANSAFSRQEFDEARALIGLMKDGALKAQLVEEANTRESVHLAERGDTLGAEKLARQLATPHAILRAYPPLVRRLVKNKDASSATVVAHEAVRRLRQAEESKAADASYVPSVLASFAGSINPFKQSRLPRALGELAEAVAPAGGPVALDILDALVEAVNKNTFGSENGNTGFNPSVFGLLAAKDEGRVRQAAESLKDRLQRISALAGLYQWKATTLAESPAAAPAAQAAAP